MCLAVSSVAGAAFARRLGRIGPHRPFERRESRPLPGRHRAAEAERPLPIAGFPWHGQTTHGSLANLAPYPDGHQKGKWPHRKRESAKRKDRHHGCFTARPIRCPPSIRLAPVERAADLDRLNASIGIDEYCGRQAQLIKSAALITPLIEKQRESCIDDAPCELFNNNSFFSLVYPYQHKLIRTIRLPKCFKLGHLSPAGWAPSAQKLRITGLPREPRECYRCSICCG